MKNFILKKLLLCIPLVLSLFFANISRAQDKLLDILSDELNLQMTGLKDQETPPYYMNYRVDELFTTEISSSFGNLTYSKESKKRILTIMVRVGSNELDNFHELREDYSRYMYSMSGGIILSLEDNPDAIRQVLWKETDNAYKEATNKLAKVKANIAVKVEEEDRSPDFSKEKASEYYEPPVKPGETNFDHALWEEKIKKYSKPFLDNPDIFIGGANINFTIERKYFVSSEGAKIAQNRVYARLFISGSIKSEDGMVLPLYKSYFAFNPVDLPDDKKIISDANEMVKKLVALKDAPVVEPYAGPALLSGEASGVFFHEIFGHRIEGQRQKSESDAQTFKKKVGENVLPDHISVIMDPTLENYNGKDLNGYYKYDDQGIKGTKVNVVENGVLKKFLMSRCPIENFPNSNGHGRAEPGRQTVSRQSNLIVETTKPLSMEELRKKLIKEVKNQDKEYGYLFANVRGGFTMTGRFIPNAFNVTPTEVYRVYIDGRPDELVRGVDLVGTPLAMFSQIEAAGDKPEIFTGTCGAESGRVPVTAISPVLFVKQIEMQKKSKSQEKPPILPRPDSER
ncbi:MAG: TldD/PmbA family protein [Bacteroidota bacterium]